MKTVHLVTPHFTPEVTAAAHRMDALAQTLSGEHMVHVYTLTGRGQCVPAREVQVSDNLIIHYTRLPRYPKSLFLVRALVEAWFSFLLAYKASRRHPDAVVATSPFMFIIPAVLLFFRGVPRIIDVRDLVWCYLPDTNLVQRSVRMMFRKMVVSCLVRYDHITVTNASEQKWILDNTGLPANRISIVQNGLSRSRFQRVTSIRFKKPDHPFVITYIGNVGNGQDLRPVIEAVKELPDVKLNIIGDGIELNRLKKMVRERGIRNVRLFGKLNWNRLLPYYQTSSLLFGRLGVNYQSAVPSKLFEYLATGLPVLFHGSGEACRLLRKYENTFVVESEAVEELQKKIIQLKTLDPARSFNNVLSIQEKGLREVINLQYFSILNSVWGLHAETFFLPELHYREVLEPSL